MTRLFCLLALLSAGSAAVHGQHTTCTLMPCGASDHRWIHRLLYVFAPSDEHPDLLAQRQMAMGFVDGFRDRDLLFVPVFEHGPRLVGGQPVDVVSAAELRDQHGVEPGDFVVILVGKDGTEKRRSDEPLSIEELFDQIDQMPMRQREMEDRKRP